MSRAGADDVERQLDFWLYAADFLLQAADF
jgi:hypothetical protein